MTTQDKRKIKAHTMACWWPSSYFPKAGPRWVAIAGELLGLAENARARNRFVNSSLVCAEADELERLARLCE